MDYSEVSSTFVRLADTHFVQRCPSVPESPEPSEAPPPPAPTLVFNEKDMYTVPRLNLVGEGTDEISLDWRSGRWWISETQPCVAVRLLD